jgi:hypothetical protein
MTSPSLVPTASGRWRYAANAVFMRILLGVIYSSSIFRGPLMQLHGWSKAETTAPYRYSLPAFAAGMILAGLWQERKARAWWRVSAACCWERAACWPRRSAIRCGESGFIGAGLLAGIMDKARAAGDLATGCTEIYWRLAVLATCEVAAVLRPPARRSARHVSSVKCAPLCYLVLEFVPNSLLFSGAARSPWRYAHEKETDGAGARGR